MRHSRFACLAQIIIAVGGIVTLAGVASRAGSVYLGGMGMGAAAPSVSVESFQQRKYRATIGQEHDFSCGSAALATLLTYTYGVKVTEDDVFKSMFENGDRQTISKYGFSLLDMKKYLQRRGIPSAGFRAPLSKLAEVGIPAIVLITVRGYRHFVVLEGIRNGWVLLSDPANGARTEQLGVFEGQWTGVSFLILSDTDHAQKIYNSAQRWAAAPYPPMDLARYAVGLATLAQPGLLDLSKF